MESSSSFVETESVVGAARRFLEGDDIAGEQVWDLSLDRATAQVLVDRCRIADVVAHVAASTKTDRLREICVGIAANLKAHDLVDAVPVVQDLFFDSADPATLGECLRYFCADPPVIDDDDLLKEKLLFIVHNSLDAALVARVFALLLRRPRGKKNDAHPEDGSEDRETVSEDRETVSEDRETVSEDAVDEDRGDEDLALAAASLLQEKDRVGDLALVDLRPFSRGLASGLGALLRFIASYVTTTAKKKCATGQRVSPATAQTIRTGCAAVRDTDCSDDDKNAAQHVIDLLRVIDLLSEAIAVGSPTE